MIATIALDAAGQWRYDGEARERDARGRFLSAAEVAEAVVTYIAREALRIAREQAEAVARTFAEFLGLMMPAPKPRHAKSERIRATAPRPPRGLTKREAAHVHQGQMWAVPLDQAKALARAHRERFGKGGVK